MTALRVRYPAPVGDPRAHLGEALHRTGAGDRAAFEDVYELTSATLLAICVRVCGDRGAAEDVLHDVYVTVWNRASAWDASRGTAMTWLSAIARNRSIDWCRARRVRLAHPIETALDVADPAPSAVSRLLEDEAHTRMRACLAGLRPHQRDAIAAAFYHGTTYAALARRYGVPEGTMKSWIRRGLAQMRQHLSTE